MIMELAQSMVVLSVELTYLIMENAIYNATMRSVIMIMAVAIQGASVIMIF